MDGADIELIYLGSNRRLLLLKSLFYNARLLGQSKTRRDRWDRRDGQTDGTRATARLSRRRQDSQNRRDSSCRGQMGHQ